MGNVDGMVRDINATFFHCLSTDRYPQHQFCPKGKESLCKYNSALAKQETLPPHKPKIPRDLAKYVRPVFIRLSNWDLLEWCSLGATQNQNESFNNLVWSKASKTQFLSEPTVTFAVDLSIITFNGGMEYGLSRLMKDIGICEETSCINASGEECFCLIFKYRRQDGHLQEQDFEYTNKHDDYMPW